MPRSTGNSAPASAARKRLSAAVLFACAAAALGAPSGAGAAPITELVISEIMFDPQGQDDGYQWIELFNGTDSVIDLSTYSLGWGGADYTTGTVQLAGTIAPGDYFVIGGPNGGLIYDMIYNFNPNLEDASGEGNAADGVALFDVMASAITPTTVPIDAVIYAKSGGTNSNGLIDETGGIGAIDVVIDEQNDGVVRRSDGGWEPDDNPTPGGGDLNVPEPRTALLVLAGLAALARARPRP